MREVPLKTSSPELPRGDQGSPSSEGGVGERVWLHRFALLTAAATSMLILAGGLVTSTGSGLAVPDWPTTFGHNMFLYPLSNMVGGIFYEHSHRLLGAVVGLLTLGLALMLWVTERRQWVKWMGGVALVAVVAQGLLGGLRVVLLRDTLAMIHGPLAHAFLALTASLALFTSAGWNRRPARAAPPDAAHLGHLGLVTTGLLYVQIVLGALLTHMGARLDAHLASAALISVLVLVVAPRTLRRRADVPKLVRPAILLGGLLVLQLFLGLGAYLGRFTSMELPLGQFSALAFPVVHRLNGGLLLVTSLVLTLRAYRSVGWGRAGAGSASVSYRVLR